MTERRRTKIVLAWLCFAASILLLAANLTGAFEMRAAVPVAMMLLILGIFIASSAKKDAG